MTKKQEAEILQRFLMINGVLIDDRIARGLKDGVREIRRAEFREKQERKRKSFQKKQRR